MSDLVPHTGFDVLQAQAQALAKSGFVPAGYRNKPDDILAAGLYGDAIGLPITSSLSYIDVIQGRPTLKPEGMLALVRSRGHAVSGNSTATAAVVTGKRRDTGDELTVEWTMEMAKRAGLAGKDTWKAYPEAMLWARAVGQLCRMLFSDVLLGLSYTPEEWADVIDVTPGPPAAEEAPPPALLQKSQAGPPGMGDSVTYVDPETGETLRRAEGQEEQERRNLMGEILAAKSHLSPDGLKNWDQQRINLGMSLTKAMKDHTLDELRQLKAVMEGLKGDPF